MMASRRMSPAQLQECHASGVTDIAELQVGIDRPVFVTSAMGGGTSTSALAIAILG